MWNLVFFKLLELSTIFIPSDGLLGNNFLKTINLSNPQWSPLNYVHNDTIFVVLLVLYAFAVICFIAGKGLPYSNLFILIFWWSFQQRFSLVSFGYDHYFTAILFVSLFLPLNKKQQKHSSSFKNENEYAGAFAFFAIAQIACIYFFSGIAKTGETWSQGVASFFLLTDLMRNNDLSCVLSQNMFFVSLTTYLTILFEIGIPLLLFVPFKNKYLRLFIAISIVLFHWGIGFLVHVGHFKFIALAVAVLLIPDFVYNKLYKSQLTSLKYVKQSVGINRVKRSVAALFIILILLQNISEIKYSFIGSIAKKVKLKTYEISSPLNQNWQFYAKDPNLNTGKLEVWLYNDDNKINCFQGLQKFRLLNQLIARYRLDKNIGDNNEIYQYLASCLLEINTKYDGCRFVLKNNYESCQIVDETILFDFKIKQN